MRTLLILSIVTVLTQSAWAIPVEDWGEWARTAQVVDNLSKNYSLLQQQYQSLQNQYQAVTGHYGWGGYQDSQNDVLQREYSPGDWQQALAGEAGGNPQRYQQLLAQYLAAHPTATVSQYQQHHSTLETQDYKNRKAVNQAVMVNARYAYNQVKHELDNIHQLSGKIDSTKNTKSAMDLNSRINVELAYIQAQSVKMQAILLQQVGQSSASQLTDDDVSTAFDQLPDKRKST